MHAYRTHTCGELGLADAGKDVVLLGWVHRLRDLGSLAFIDIRDRHGVTQVVARDNPALVAAVQELRPEYVIAVIGKVEQRGYSLIPLNLHYAKGRIKLEVALAKGKLQHDKRADKREKDWQREKQRLLRSR